MLIPYGKKQIELKNEGMMVRARMVGGGELPEALSGLWTSMGIAKIAVENFNRTRVSKNQE